MLDGRAIGHDVWTNGEWHLLMAGGWKLEADSY
jgi:hypothetical protein